MLKKRFINRVNSDRADTNSVSMILWIVLTVVLVITIGAIIYNTIKNKATAVGHCIDQSNTLFSSYNNTSCTNSDSGIK